MDCEYDSGSEEDSFILEAEDGDAVFMYNCNEMRPTTQNNHVTRIVVSSREPSTFNNVVYLTNDSTSSDGVSSNFKQPCRVQFEEAFHMDPLPEAHEKPYQDLEEALSVLDAASCNTKVPSQNSNSNNSENLATRTNCAYGGALSNDPAPHSAETSDVNPPPDLIDSSHTETLRENFTKPNEGLLDTKTPPLPPPPPALFNQTEPCTNSSNIVTSTNSENKSSQASKTNHLDSNGTDVSEQPSDVASGEKGHIGVSQEEQPSPPGMPSVSDNNTSLPKQTVIAASTSENTNSVPGPSLDGQKLAEQDVPAVSFIAQTSESSFHYPEPTRPDPVVCVPVKEVKFDEPPKHQEVKAKENFLQNHGGEVQVPVQSSSTPQNTQSTADPNSQSAATQFHAEAKDKTTSPSKATHAPLELSESKMSNNKGQDLEIPSNSGGQDQVDQSIGIIGNEDNLSEVTLPPLSDVGAFDPDHSSSHVTNGLPRHRIRVSIDQNPPAPSRRAVALTVVLVILLIVVLTLIVTYKFVLKNTSE